MKKTLLLCFIHGFKGDDNTFGTFPEHLRALVSHGLPKVDVKVIIYPTYDTFGDLAECVSRFRDWLQEKVIDIEVANATPSPTVDPSVRVILVGHSMGGIVAADALLSLTSDKPVEHAAGESKSAKGEAEGEGKAEEEKAKGDGDVKEKNEGGSDVKEGTEINSFMFPYIQGVLAFDTPYLGIAPGVVAHGAEDHYNAASSTLAQISGLTGAVGSLWGGAKANEESKDKKKEPVAALPAPEIPATAPAWQRWGKMAMYAGAVGAVAATGAAAYLKRGEIISGWNWAGSHLEFVGCLMKGEELKKRVAGVITLNKELQVGFANLYTRLGKKAVNKEGSMVGSVIGNQRTFCNMPKKEGGARDFFHEAINDEAQDEVSAHMTMFFPKDNPGYYALSEDAKKLIVEWSINEWYESSTGGDTMKDFGIENSDL